MGWHHAFRTVLNPGLIHQYGFVVFPFPHASRELKNIIFWSIAHQYPYIPNHSQAICTFHRASLRLKNTLFWSIANQDIWLCCSLSQNHVHHVNSAGPEMWRCIQQSSSTKWFRVCRSLYNGPRNHVAIILQDSYRYSSLYLILYPFSQRFPL